jgi:anti-sigma B factor antagonist
VGEQAEFAVETIVGDGTVVVAVQGEVDPVTAPELEQALFAAAQGARDLIVDLSGTTFFDSSGIHALMRVGSWANAEGTRLSLVCGPSCVRSVLEITGVDALYEMHPTIGGATRAAEAAPRARLRDLSAGYSLGS